MTSHEARGFELLVAGGVTNETEAWNTEVQALIGQAILRLPTLGIFEVPQDDNCGICLQSFVSIAEEDPVDQGTCELACGEEVQLSGVTRLAGCGHMFCRLECVILLFVLLCHFKLFTFKTVL